MNTILQQGCALTLQDYKSSKEESDAGVAQKLIFITLIRLGDAATHFDEPHFIVYTHNAKMGLIGEDQDRRRSAPLFLMEVVKLFCKECSRVPIALWIFARVTK